MKVLRYTIVALTLILLCAGVPLLSQKAPGKPMSVSLDNLSDQHPQNVKTELVTYKGHKALQVIDAASVNVADGLQLVVLNTPEFKDGTIEVEMAGAPKENSENSAARGFVGMAFRLTTDATNAPHYECFYVRPTNGRTEDQVRRNHATQYISFPDRPWFELRKDFPGKYESYADMVAGEWIKMRIEVHGKKANLFLNDAPQPVLVVTDLTQAQGKIALWVGTDTVAHFADLRVTPSN
jgi:3-keto-disaccharide hydrolase